MKVESLLMDLHTILRFSEFLADIVRFIN